MGATLTTMSSALKNNYLGPIRDQINKSSPIWYRLKKSTKDVVGKYAIIPLKVGNNEGAGSRAENGILPTAGNVSYEEIKTALKYIYGVMSVSGPTVKASQSDVGAFTRVMQAESESIKQTMSLDFNRQIHGNQNASLGQCGVGTSNTIIQMASDCVMENIRVGMIVDIVTTSTGAIDQTYGDSITITAVSKADKTFTVADGGSITTAATDNIRREDSQLLTASYEMTGLAKILDATDTVDLYGIDTSATANWLPNVKDFSGAEFNLSDFQDLFDDCDAASGFQPTALFSQANLRKKYWLLLTGNRQYTGVQPEKVLDGGFRALEYTGGGNAVPWILDRFTPSGQIIGLHEPHIEFRHMPGALLALVDIKGEVWIPEISGSSGTDAYKAVLYTYMEMIATHRNSHIRAYDVKVD